MYPEEWVSKQLMGDVTEIAPPAAKRHGRINRGCTAYYNLERVCDGRPDALLASELDPAVVAVQFRPAVGFRRTSVADLQRKTQLQTKKLQVSAENPTMPMAGGQKETRTSHCPSEQAAAARKIAQRSNASVPLELCIALCNPRILAENNGDRYCSKTPLYSSRGQYWM